MKNIGPVSRRWLAEIGILTRDDLMQVGAVAAWTHLRARYPQKVTKNLLWALLGAERDLDWRQVPDQVKQQAIASLSIP
ncbi:MAG: TfoX/Sxy family DNA transformation protein [Cyanobacteria bacterium J06627_8]